MELLYPHEHLNCYNYEKGDRPAIDPIYLNTEDRYNIDILENKIIILRSGLLNFSFGSHLNQTLTPGNMIIIPAGFRFTSKALADTNILIFRIRTNVELCERFALEQLLLEKEDGENFDNIGVLDSNEVINRVYRKSDKTHNCRSQMFLFLRNKNQRAILFIKRVLR